MSFSHDIKKVRTGMLLSQQDFAAELGVAFSTVNRWENGKAMPTFKAMKAIDTFCKKNNVDYDIKTVLEETDE